MRLRMGKRIALLLCVLMLCTSALADAGTADEAVAAAYGCRAGQLLANRAFPALVDADDWFVIALAQSGTPERYDAYLNKLEKAVSEAYRLQGCLSASKVTETQRAALTVLALGGDPRNFGGADLVADGTWNFERGVESQGLNGVVYALLLLDAGEYAIPQKAAISRESLVQMILDAQQPSGGFGLMMGQSDPDMTAMCVQALAPYADDCGEAIENALAFLSKCRTESGGYVSFGEPSPETTAQVVIALCCLGIDPATDSRFCMDENTLLTELERYRTPDGAYSRSPGGEVNLMTTSQILLAQTALERLHTDGLSVYDFSSYEAPASTRGVFALWVAPAILLVLAALVMERRKGRT